MLPPRLRTARPTRFAGALIALATLIMAPGACTKVPLTAPSGTAMTLLSTSNVLPVNGSTDIVALLVRNGTTTSPGTGTPGTPSTPGTPVTGTVTTTSSSSGTPVHDGTVVTFTTTLGHMEPSEVKTSGGQAVAKLVADGKSGVATVTAFSGGASQTLAVNIGAAGAARVVVTASPQALPPTGGNSSIIATIQDQQGNPIAGVPVAFSTSAGSLAATSVVTDTLGNSTTTLSTAAPATVTVTAGGGTTGTLSGTVAVTLQPNATLTLTPPATITASTPATFTVSASNVIATDATIDFGDGESTPLGPLNSQRSVTHLYATGGRTYKVKLTGTFADGTVVPITTDVVVADWDVSVTCQPPTTTQFGTTTFTATTVPAGVLISTYVWTLPEDSGNAKIDGNPATYVWQSRGTHVVQLDVVPAKGATKHRTPCSVQVN